MRPAVRVGFVVLGAAMAVYGAASLTGGWLGTPPWWEMREPSLTLIERRLREGRVGLFERRWADLMSNDPVRVSNAAEPPGPHNGAGLAPLDDPERGERFEGEFGITLRPARRWVSGSVVAAGLALVAVGAWPRRRAGAAT